MTSSDHIFFTAVAIFVHRVVGWDTHDERACCSFHIARSISADHDDLFEENDGSACTLVRRKTRALGLLLDYGMKKLQVFTRFVCTCFTSHPHFRRGSGSFLGAVCAVSRTRGRLCRPRQLGAGSAKLSQKARAFCGGDLTLGTRGATRHTFVMRCGHLFIWKQEGGDLYSPSFPPRDASIAVHKNSKELQTRSVVPACAPQSYAPET